MGHLGVAVVPSGQVQGVVSSGRVRGEAREAAERGKLVPVRFDDARMPMDVRAIHTTDIDGWGEDANSAPAQECLRALAAMVVRNGGAAAGNATGGATAGVAAGGASARPGGVGAGSGDGPETVSAGGARADSNGDPGGGSPSLTSITSPC